MTRSVWGVFLALAAVGVVGTGVDQALSQAKPQSVDLVRELETLRDRVQALEKADTTVTIVLSAATVALFIFAIMIAVVTIFGWREIKEYLSRHVELTMKRSYDELSGRLHGFTGVIYGRLCRGQDERIERHDFLDEAITLTRKAYQSLEGSDHRWLVMNNLAYYYALKGDRANAPYAVEMAEQLRRRYSEIGNHNFLTTYARVVAEFRDYYPEPRKKLEEIRTMLHELINSPDVPERHKVNARRHLERVGRALGQ